ncbi:TOBE domain-containing protein [Roseateles cellulosilyticus]|uniref:TOBE domain-containing protein n=1 Tax=Pelomonas cellulosilytica TaxID=2906762 RepID=A0ABS8Y0I2_9BURK|nr:TOBE domain-containing protein [Pelomonas sp. P8]MCE4556531.1 TOBE domain-containing protein [Pelomonas sp. P8]
MPPQHPGASAVNALDCTVRQLADGPINCELTLALPGGEPLVTVVTRDAVRALGLAEGAAVRALVHAPSVVLATGGGGPLARNQLPGTVTALHTGPLRAEVAVALAGGTVVLAVVSVEAVAVLGLAVGAAAQVLIQPSQVMLAG